MATPTIPENDGPALALSDLYEANDLLNVLRHCGEADMESSDWTLTCEIKRRMDSAIAYLDHHVPEPDAAADETPVKQERVTDNPLPARDALAAWDKINDAHGSLNLTIETADDSAFYEPDGTVPTETVRNLETAAVLLSQVNALLERSVGATEPAPSFHGEPVNSLKELGELPPVDDWQKSVNVWALAGIDKCAAQCSILSDTEVASELRKFQYHVSENMDAGETEDRYTVRHDWTLKGIRWFLATQRFYESLLSEDEMPAKGGAA